MSAPDAKGARCEATLLIGTEREAAVDTIRRNHYSHSVPSGKSHVFRYGSALVVFSIPANQHIAKFLFGVRRPVWELTRLWAPDGHDPNLLSRAMSAAVTAFIIVEPEVVALVSYADPNVGHSGGVYRSCSWVEVGQSTEGRYYRKPGGPPVARRSFHSGRRSLKKAEILAMGYREEKRPGKLRFAKGLKRWSRKLLARRVAL